MYVRDWMNPDVITTSPRARLVEARALMEGHNIRQVPVVSGDRLVGILTDRDVRDALPSIFEYTSPRHRDQSGVAQRIHVEDVMTVGAHHVAPSTHLGEVALLLLTHNIGGLPVLYNDQLVGIITRTDLLRAIIAGSPVELPDLQVYQEPDSRDDAELLEDVIVETIELRPPAGGAHSEETLEGVALQEAS